MVESVSAGASGKNASPPYATVAGTARYRSRFAHLDPDHFRLRYGLWLSSIGLGSYLPPGDGSGSKPINLVDGLADGDEPQLFAPDAFSPDAFLMDDRQDTDTSGSGEPPPDTGSYFRATQTALQLGCNVLDTAINYRATRSEQEIGAALRALIEEEVLRRDEVLVCTKGGYLTPGMDAANERETPEEITEEETTETARVIEQGLATADEIVGPDVGGPHCIAPAYLRACISRSLSHLGLEAIDVYYLHNPETQLQAVGPQEFRARMRRAFEQLESEAADGRIRLYGVATWDGLCADPQDRIYLPLTWLEELAREVGGEKHRFRFIQFPYNALTRTAFSARNQPLPGREDMPDAEATSGEPVFGPLLAAAMQLGLTAVTSATLAQRRVLDRLPAQFARALGEWDTRAQAAIQFNRSTPGVTTTLVGMGEVAHVEENMAVAAHAPLSQERFFRLFQRPQTE